MTDQALIDAVLLLAERVRQVPITITSLWGMSVFLIAVTRKQND